MKISIFVLLLLICGCAQEPVEHIKEAKEIVEGSNCRNAEEKLNIAMIEIASQNSKFELFREYGIANKLLDSAIVEARHCSDVYSRQQVINVRNLYCPHCGKELNVTIN